MAVIDISAAEALPNHAAERGWRRGACPGLSAPMQTGDGLLVRLLPLGTIALDAFAGLCAAAQRHGNGIIEVTARGSIQVRGLSAASAPLFADAVAACGIAASAGVAIFTNALAGFCAEEILDASLLGAELRRALTRTELAANLAPKISVVIDGGGRLTLDALDADVRLCAYSAANGGALISVGVGGDGASAIGLGLAAPADAVEIGMRLLGLLARYGRRARDVLAVDGVEPFHAALSSLLLRSPETNEAVEQKRSGGERQKADVNDAIKLHRLRDASFACGIGLAFGHSEAAALLSLTEAARAAGAIGIRATAGRVLLILGVAAKDAPSLVASAAKLGFIVQRDDPRLRIVACAGAPFCSSAHIPTRVLAPVAAERVGRLLDGAVKIHISGCGKSCAHAGPAALTIVGSAQGCMVIVNGAAGDAASEVIDADDVPTALARWARQARRDGEHA
jgi:precorrin-3B synthase